MENRIKGSIICSALGDALGAPHELRTKSGVYTGRLQYTTTITRRFHSSIILPSGAVTDDTQMTFALLQSLIRNKSFNKSDVILSYMEWANRKPDCLGVNTRMLFRNIKTLRGYESRKKKLNENNQSIGSLMRVSALAFLPLSLSDTELREIIDTDTKITNLHNNNLVCNIVHVMLIRGCLQNKSKVELFEMALNFTEEFKDIAPEACSAILQALHNEVRCLCNVIIPDVDVDANTTTKIKLKNDEQVKPVPRLKNDKGWVCHGIYCSVLGLFHFETPYSAIDAIIRMGGDTDTNAKIAGDLLGAYYGFDVLNSSLSGCSEEQSLHNITLLLQVNEELTNIDETVHSVCNLFNL